MKIYCRKCKARSKSKCKCTMFGDYRLSDLFKDMFKYAEYCERLPFQVELARVKACIGKDGKMDLSKLKREG